MNFHNALRAVRNALASRPDVYVANEGANALLLQKIHFN